MIGYEKEVLDYMRRSLIEVIKYEVNRTLFKDQGKKIKLKKLKLIKFNGFFFKKNLSEGSKMREFGPLFTLSMQKNLSQ